MTFYTITATGTFSTVTNSAIRTEVLYISGRYKVKHMCKILLLTAPSIFRNNKLFEAISWPF